MHVCVCAGIKRQASSRRIREGAGKSSKPFKQQGDNAILWVGYSGCCVERLKGSTGSRDKFRGLCHLKRDWGGGMRAEVGVMEWL